MVSYVDQDVALLEWLHELSKDMRESCRKLTRKEARFLVDTYYQIQHIRISTGQQADACDNSGEPVRFLGFVHEGFTKFENVVRTALHEFAKTYRVGRWCLSQYGVGPVITAGLLAHIDIRIAVNVGKIWRFAGLDPTLKWEKGQKRPYNAFLKTLCAYKLGESFVHTCNSDKSFYGKLYKTKKNELIAMNEAGKFAERARAEMEKAKEMGYASKLKGTEKWKCWEQGRLSPAHIHAMARRWAVKLFLSHLHYCMYEDYYGMQPPLPYVFAYDGGVHSVPIMPDGWPVEDGVSLRELYKEEVAV